MAHVVVQVDAFTTRPLEGNPAAVVLEADDLDERTMRAIAREMNCSETAFVLRPTRPDATVRVRFFTPAEEIPLCGHATVATFHVLAERGIVAAGARLAMECPAGVIPIEVGERAGASVVTMLQNPGKFSAAPMRGMVALAAGLPPDVLAPRPPVELVSTGTWSVIAPVASIEVLAHAEPVAERIAALAPASLGLSGLYLVALSEPDARPASARARFFGAEGLGVVEDPVTGSAAGALVAWLGRHGRLGPGERVTIDQGIECGRPGRVDGRLVDAGGALRPEITGQAVTVFATTLAI